MFELNGTIITVVALAVVAWIFWLYVQLVSTCNFEEPTSWKTVILAMGYWVTLHTMMAFAIYMVLK